MGRDTKAMQDDDTANPGMLCGARRRGAVERARPAPPANPAPTAIGDAQVSMKGVAARYPAFDAALARPVDLEQRINLCRTEHQQATAVRL